MSAINMNMPTYTLNASTISSSVSLSSADWEDTTVVAYNSGSTPVLILSASSAAPTAVFPTSSAAVTGTVIAAGAIQVVSKNAYDRFISGITSSGTSTVYLQLGVGE